jgi:hypothetical protein
MPAQPLADALDLVRAQLLDADRLVRAVGTGRRRGSEPPRWRRVELRSVDLKAGRRLQVTAYDDQQAHTTNHEPGPDAEGIVAELLREPFGNWHVDTLAGTHQLRVTKKGEALLHTSTRSAAPADGAAVAREHDRDKDRLLPQDDPVFVALGLSDHQGRMKPSRQAKYRQVEEFLRILDASVSEALAKGHLRTPTVEDPLRIADLGCGNGYLTLAAQRYLTHVRGLPVTMTGVDVRRQSADHNTAVATGLGLAATFVVGSIGEVVVDPAPEVVLALHACDTATDDALAQAVAWRAPLVLAAPCCHHDLAAQLRRTLSPEPYAMLTRHGILRERFADTLTDAVRASLLRTQGYRVDVMQFVESKHTPRNTLLRAVRTGSSGDDVRREYDELVGAWSIRPRLADLLADQPDDADA